MPKKRTTTIEADDARRAEVFRQRVEEQDTRFPGYGQMWQLLATRVLANGGTMVVPPLRPDVLVRVLTDRGKVMDGKIRLVLGEVSSCHRNSVKLWREGKGAICSGYGLSKDGLWREHSWCFSERDEILETTEERVKYFGIRMQQEGAERFAKMVGG